MSCYEQRRLASLGTLNQTTKISGSRAPGTESDLSYSLPLKTTTASASGWRRARDHTIRHIVPYPTAAADQFGWWVVTSLNNDAITRLLFPCAPQSYIGASNVQPVIINNTLIYGAARGGHVREMAYNWRTSGFLTGDLSARATCSTGWTSWICAYNKSPSRWCGS